MGQEHAGCGVAPYQLMAVPVAGGFYQPLSGKDLRARGVLDGDTDLGLACMTPDVVDHARVRELLDQAVALAREAAGEAARGELGPRPETCAFKGGCQYPTICRCER